MNSIDAKEPWSSPRIELLDVAQDTNFGGAGAFDVITGS
jgi:hypothetical protein